MATDIAPRGIHRRTEFVVDESLRTRLLRGIQVGAPDECWPWIGAMRNGYGAIKQNNKVLGTHVVSYVVHKGPLKDGELVTHDCDNRACCNPKHLQAGTTVTNVREMYSRRDVLTPRGELAWNATLTNESVRLIHAYKIVTNKKATEIGKLVGCSRHCVNNVLSKSRWAHVPVPTAEEAAELVRQHQASNP